tara:strand:- start:397 stop:546 length:150 start_codon:yes stop_codon:yes gene_type:complete
MKLSKLIDQVNAEFWDDSIEEPKTKRKGKRTVVIHEPDSLKTISIKEIK